MKWARDEGRLSSFPTATWQAVRVARESHRPRQAVRTETSGRLRVMGDVGRAPARCLASAAHAALRRSVRACAVARARVAGDPAGSRATGVAARRPRKG